MSQTSCLGCWVDPDIFWDVMVVLEIIQSAGAVVIGHEQGLYTRTLTGAGYIESIAECVRCKRYGRVYPGRGPRESIQYKIDKQRIRIG